MTNNQIADQFTLLSRLMDLHGEDSFKAKSYASAAFNIEKLPAEVTTMNEAELFSMKGIGKSTGGKILELLSTGRMMLLDEIIARTPAGVLEMMQIKGLGPKKVAVIWKELGLESVGELEYACNENRLVTLKGFGAKTQDSILQSIAYLRQNEGFFLWSQAETIANELLASLNLAFPGNKFTTVGTIRMQRETIEVIDILTTADRSDVLYDYEIKGAVLSDREGAVMISMPGLPKLLFHFTDELNFIKNKFLLTGSKEFLDEFTAKQVISEYVDSEEELFTINGLQYIPPAMRETTAVIIKAHKEQLKPVIQPGDIKGIIHSHSTYSDGQNTIEEMMKAAIEKGFEYLVLSDHSQAAYYANGLTPERIALQHAEIDQLNSKYAPFRVFKSIEADILNDGSLDYSSQVLSTFDLVIASVHSNLKMTEDKAMARVMAAIANPYTTILGHPTGRLLLSRQGYPLDHKRIIDACAEHNVVIEINAHPRRLDLDWRWIDYAMEKGVLLSIDPDAHSINGFKDVYYGVMAAQKGGLTASNNLSSYTLAQFEEFLVRCRSKRSMAVV